MCGRVSSLFVLDAIERRMFSFTVGLASLKNSCTMEIVWEREVEKVSGMEYCEEK